MLRSVHKYLLQFFVTFCMAACAGVSEIGNPSEGDSNFISFNVSETMTKVSNDDITDHLLCIYIYDDGNLLGGRDWSNYRLKYYSSSACWRFWNTSTGLYEDIEWGTGEHEFYAYSDTRYYILGVGDILPAYDVDDKSLKHTGVINIAQVNSYAERPNQNYKKDMIYASATRNVEDDGYGPVSLEFDHALASLLIEVKNNSNSDKNITICSLRDVRLEATNPTLKFADGSFTPSLSSVDNPGIAFGGGTVPRGESFIATGGPVVIWPQDIENQWLELSISGVSNIVKNMDSDFGTTRWEAGKLYHYIVNIPSPVELESPSASISHTMTDGVLTGSAVTLNLGATQEQLSKIKGLTVNVKRDGTNYRTYSVGDDVVASSNTISISSGYLPRGTYTVECSYMSGLDEMSFTIDNVISPAPTGLTYNVTANADTPGILTVTDASVNISAAVLAELALTEVSLIFTSEANRYEPAISPVSLGADFEAVETEADAGEYNLTSSVTFDRVVLSTTGGPYTVEAAADVGWYVNIDGTFSETFISSSSNASGYSIARIFYMDDISSDTQLALDYSYCTRGLAYEVDDSGNIVDNRNWNDAITSWNTTTTQKLNSPDIIRNNSAYSSVDNIHGYSNTVAIKSEYNSGFISAVDTSSPCVQGVTSPWYIASLGELKEIKKQTNFTTSYSYYIWTSTIAGETGWIDGVYYNIAKMWSIYWIDTTGNTASAYGSSAKHGYVRILAF